MAYISHRVVDTNGNFQGIIFIDNIKSHKTPASSSTIMEKYFKNLSEVGTFTYPHQTIDPNKFDSRKIHSSFLIN